MATSTTNETSVWRDWWKTLAVALASLVLFMIIAMVKFADSSQGRINASQDRAIETLYVEKDRQTRLIEEIRNTLAERKPAIEQVYKLGDRLTDLERRFYGWKGSP